jgi:hypothetical protein
MRPAAQRCALSRGIRIRSGRWRSRRTSGRCGRAAGTIRSSCGMRPAAPSCAPSRGDSASVRSVARRLSHRAHLHMDRIEWKLAVQHVPHVGRDDTARPNNAHHFLDHRTPAPPTRTRRTRCASSRRQRQLRRTTLPRSLECTPRSGQGQAADLTICRACSCSNLTGLRYPSAEWSRLLL